MSDELLHLTVLGSATPYTSVDNPCSGYLVSSGDTRIWVDAGSGTLGPLRRHVRPDELDAIWISHPHADHSADLLTAYYGALYADIDLAAPIPLYGPEGIADRLAHFLTNTPTRTRPVPPAAAPVRGSHACCSCSAPTLRDRLPIAVRVTDPSPCRSRKGWHRPSPGPIVVDMDDQRTASVDPADSAGSIPTPAWPGETTGEVGATSDMTWGEETAEVRRFWGRLGLPGLVDVHTHFMPERVLHKVWGYFDAQGPLTGGLKWSIGYRQEEAERTALLRRFGVRAFTAMLYPHKPGMARWLNGWAADFARRTPDSLHTATLYPEPGVDAYVREAVEVGARVFKAHVQVGAYDPADELLQPAWGILAESRIPVVIHCGSGPAPGRHTGPGPIAKVLARHPELRLIVAHLGMPEYEEFLDLAERHGQVRLDTTMAFTDFTEDFMPFPRRALPRLTALGDRILLGSDFPNIPYSYAHQLHALERLDLGREWLRAVCHDNAARLFGL